MEPLQTWWTTELYPTSDEDNFGVVGNFEVVKAADAQATIAALEQRVKELKQWVQDQSTANLETMRHMDEMQSRAMDAESQLTQRTAEFQRHDGELQQICGQALGYPWFKDDQKNFPGATEKDGVCVGEHVGITIAQELADAYRKHTSELEAANTLLYKKNCALGRAETSINDLQAELERVRGELATYKETKHDAI